MNPRKTKARLAIAVTLLGGGSSVQWGYELSRKAEVGAGSMYPFLGELLEGGHLTSDWEPEAPNGRPPRRYYRVTDSGEKFLRDFVASAPAARAARGRLRPTRPAVEL